MSTRKEDEDKQGVLRGECTIESCPCRQYASKNGLRCVKCSHTPAKHQNMTNTSSSQQHISVRPSGAIGRLHREDNTSRVSSDTSYARVVQSQPQAFVSSVGVSPQSQYGYPGSYDTRWPECKNTGCSNPVHYEAGIDFFDYCTPRCRDEHFLPKYNQKLAEDIANYCPSKPVSDIEHYSPSSSHSSTGHSVSHLTSHSTSRYSTGRSTSNSRILTLETKPNKDLGLQLLEINSEITVVGMNANVLKLFYDKKVCLLDVVVFAEGENTGRKTFSDVNELREFVKPKTRIRLLLDTRSHDVKMLFDEFFLTEKRKDVNGVYCIPAPPDGIDYGFQVDENLIVKLIFSGSIAEKCGLKEKDEIKSCAFVKGSRIHKVECSSKDVFEMNVKNFLTDKFYMVVGVRRQTP